MERRVGRRGADGGLIEGLVVEELLMTQRARFEDFFAFECVECFELDLLPQTGEKLLSWDELWFVSGITTTTITTLFRDGRRRTMDEVEEGGVEWPREEAVEEGDERVLNRQLMT